MLIGTYCHYAGYLRDILFVIRNREVNSGESVAFKLSALHVGRQVDVCTDNDGLGNDFEVDRIF